MKLYKEMQDYLRARRNCGETNQAIADSAGMSQSHINKLLNDPEEVFGKMKLEHILRLFPSIQIIMPGSPRVVLQDAQGNIVNGDGNIVNSGNGSRVGEKSKTDTLRDALLSRILDSKIEDSAKVVVLKIIKDTEV